MLDARFGIITHNGQVLDPALDLIAICSCIRPKITKAVPCFSIGI